MNTQNAATSAATQAIRMFANFERQYFVPLTGELEDKNKLYEKLKADNVGLSRHSMELLLAGSEPLIRGFEVVDVANKHVVSQAAKRPEGVAERIFMSAGYKPAGEFKPVRHGSVIARGLEALKDGCTLEQLSAAIDHESVDQTKSFLTRPKKRGYGLRFDADTKEYFLIFPEGQTEIAYKAKGDTSGDDDKHD